MVLFRLFCFAFLTALVVAAPAPSLKEHFGFVPGEDYKLADYTQLVSYFKKLDAASDRIAVLFPGH